MYDLIVCNPPYFEDSLKSAVPQRTTARHNVSLSYDELFDCVGKLLLPKGRFALIIPAGQIGKVSRLAEAHKLFLIRKTNVYPTPNSKIKRYLLEYSKTEQELVETDLVIELLRHCYTSEYKALMNDFYL